ncbi:hypothetical protein ACFVR1_14685 [Psychrobacillus sp. NPDC058041]|uniref:hypothetical protein n=1 Tax=Psychrobacillus sp. NPDC058041 TaxID=3346310 RepID=UPI0036DE7E6D
MKEIFGVILLLSVLLFGCTNEDNALQVQSQEKVASETTNTSENEEQTVLGVVEKFGKSLQHVSLLGPKEQLEENMQDYYGDIVSPELIKQWLTDPIKAPGRLSSSPWPDRIDIITKEKKSEHAYTLSGEIIEIANIDEVVSKIPIKLVVEKVRDQWLINEVTLGKEEQSDSITYKNNEYGFIFKLPKTWENYSIVTDKWEGLAISTSEGEKVVETGPIISLRHPEWTLENPRQDIPIMIFTIEQWNLLQQEKFHIGAAPIGPSELNRNEKYVFALPARYNFAFPTGYEEVEKIIEGKPLEVGGV